MEEKAGIWASVEKEITQAYDQAVEKPGSL